MFFIFEWRNSDLFFEVISVLYNIPHFIWKNAKFTFMSNMCKFMLNIKKCLSLKIKTNTSIHVSFRNIKVVVVAVVETWIFVIPKLLQNVLFPFNVFNYSLYFRHLDKCMLCYFIKQKYMVCIVLQLFDHRCLS